MLVFPNYVYFLHLVLLFQKNLLYFFFLSFFFFCSEFCHTLKWNGHGFTCVPHPDPPSHLPLHPLPKFTFVYCDTGFFIQEFHNCLECCLEKKHLIFFTTPFTFTQQKGVVCPVAVSRWEETCKHFSSSWGKKFFKKPFIFKITNSFFFLSYALLSLMNGCDCCQTIITSYNCLWFSFLYSLWYFLSISRENEWKRYFTVIIIP